ncbi:hypothetical protein GCM10009716_39440 [Streptomyces sodiiphilus]|uniref:Uncharacterized protein n=1 Tax=Streptomyces sodiiphilus TaxID=226217 RepID=A0ABN2PSM3_9ACTN
MFTLKGFPARPARAHRPVLAEDGEKGGGRPHRPSPEPARKPAGPGSGRRPVPTPAEVFPPRRKRPEPPPGPGRE